MTKRDVAELACKILALFYLIANLHTFLTTPVSVGMTIWRALRYGEFEETGIAMLIIATATGFILLLVWFLWTRSWWIAKKMVPDDANYSRWPRLRVADVQVVAFSMVGLFTLVNGVQYLARSFGLYFGSLHADHYDRRMSFLEWLSLDETLASIVGCVLGLWLILGSRGIVRLIRRLRRPELHEGPEVSQENQELPVVESGSE
jgi:hypothetical protein